MSHALRVRNTLTGLLLLGFCFSCGKNNPTASYYNKPLYVGVTTGLDADSTDTTFGIGALMTAPFTPKVDSLIISPLPDTVLCSEFTFGDGNCFFYRQYRIDFHSIDTISVYLYTSLGKFTGTVRIPKAVDSIYASIDSISRNKTFLTVRWNDAGNPFYEANIIAIGYTCDSSRNAVFGCDSTFSNLSLSFFVPDSTDSIDLLIDVTGVNGSFTSSPPVPIMTGCDVGFLSCNSTRTRKEITLVNSP